MKTNKVKGFTLIELIVVIAIIGVLAAILVPSMLGYVSKSKTSAANADAKSLFNAVATSLVDLDTEGNTVVGSGTWTGADAELSATEKTAIKGKVGQYFSDYANIDEFVVTITAGTVDSAVAKNGNYVGQYPNPRSVDDSKNGDMTFKGSTSSTSST